MSGGSVYIVTNRPNGTLYLGVTNDLGRRIFEHRSLRTPGFTKRYSLTKLVWYEHNRDIRNAIQRERTMKHRSRAWKVRLIFDMNPFGHLLELFGTRRDRLDDGRPAVGACHLAHASTGERPEVLARKVQRFHGLLAQRVGWRARQRQASRRREFVERVVARADQARV